MPGVRTRSLRFLIAIAVVTAIAAAAESSATDPGAIDTKLAEARRLHLTDSTRSRTLAEEALAAAREQKLVAQEVAALIELTIALRRQNQNGTALHHIRQALALVDSLSSRPLLMRTLKEAGHTYWAFSEPATALEYFQRALRLAEEDGSIAGQADAHAGISVATSDLGDAETSLRHRLRALEFAEQAGEPRRIAFYAGNVGNSYFERKNHPLARQYIERALAIHVEQGDRTSADDMRVALARIDIDEGRVAEAERTLLEILPDRRRLRGRIKLSMTLLQLAHVARRQGRYEQAFAYLDEAWGYASAMSSRGLNIDILDAMAETHEAQGNFRGAIEALRKRQAEAAALAGEKAQARAAEVREAFAAERREAEIARLTAAEETRTRELRLKEAELAQHTAELRARQAELERARTLRYALAGALVLGLAALGAVISRQRVKLGAERRILEQARAAQQAAEEADRIKTRFLGIASHDIRGPLGNIVNLAALLRTEKGDPELEAERCDLIGAEAQRVMSLVEDLITTAALESGRLELRPAPLDLTAVAIEAIDSLRWQAAAKRQHIDFPPVPEGHGALHGDRARLAQVVSNLLSNAIKFSPAGATISLTLTRDEQHVRLTVRDQGPGIAENDIGRLFTPFERLATHPTAGESSHGLGLSIAQEIVRRHHGIIRVESKPGQGAAFIVELPLAPTSAN